VLPWSSPPLAAKGLKYAAAEARGAVTKSSSGAEKSGAIGDDFIDIIEVRGCGGV
jgi:hypothetical protein